MKNKTNKTIQKLNNFLLFSGLLVIFAFLSLIFVSQKVEAVEIPPEEWCIRADLNKDGRVDIGDLGLFVGHFGETGCTENNNWCNGADINRDGEVGGKNDFEIFETHYGDTNCSADGPWCNGADVNKDGRVESSGDITAIKDNFGKNDCGDSNNHCENADVNKDGKVDSADLNILLTNYGRNDCKSENNWCDGADTNQDGKVEGTGDLGILKDNFGRTDCGNSNNWCNGADTNQDGKVNDTDLCMVLLEMGKENCSADGPWCDGADVNRDGKVDIEDLGILSGNYGQTNCNAGNNWCNGADINQDGKVGTSLDLAKIQEFYGTQCSRECTVPNGTGIQYWTGTEWGVCEVTSCNEGYHKEGNQCVQDSAPASPAGGGGGGYGYTDTTPPVIKGEIKVEPGTTSAKITWETNEKSLTWILYGLTTDYGEEIKSTEYKTLHSVTLQNLSPQTTYYYQIKTIDRIGNQSSPEDYAGSFTTLANEILGCMDNRATNYNPNATVNNGSCVYPPGVFALTFARPPKTPETTPEETPKPVLGCTDEEAINYNPEATVDDGSCRYEEEEETVQESSEKVSFETPKASQGKASLLASIGRIVSLGTNSKAVAVIVLLIVLGIIGWGIYTLIIKKSKGESGQ